MPMIVMCNICFSVTVFDHYLYQTLFFSSELEELSDRGEDEEWESQQIRKGVAGAQVNYYFYHNTGCWSINLVCNVCLVLRSKLFNYIYPIKFF